MISFELGKSLRQHFVAGQFLGLLRTSVQSETIQSSDSTPEYLRLPNRKSRVVSEARGYHPTVGPARNGLQNSKHCINLYYYCSQNLIGNDVTLTICIDLQSSVLRFYSRIFASPEPKESCCIRSTRISPDCRTRSEEWRPF
jgi:hypothetical protein